jgi:deoxycytidylate deaminase
MNFSFDKKYALPAQDSRRVGSVMVIARHIILLGPNESPRGRSCTPKHTQGQFNQY